MQTCEDLSCRDVLKNTTLLGVGSLSLASFQKDVSDRLEALVPVWAIVNKQDQESSIADNQVRLLNHLKINLSLWP